MSECRKGFYVTGGSLRSDTPSYIKRQADADLYDALMQGEFCYILTARQMGKSSLMARTTARLREEAARVVILDLTAVGQNLTVDQWYFSLLGLMGEQLDLEAELQEYWSANERAGPMRRFMGALSAIVLPNIAGRIVVFIDEIDVVRSLPFSSDEFFAAIREFYNRRSENPEFDRLTFCLLGVATPTDLIRDTRTTPFNIGRRIDLTDFTAVEAAPLREGLSLEDGASTEQRDCLLERVLYWTGGHPYLTQRLLEGVRAEIDSCRQIDISCKLVDSVSEALFLSSGARDRDDNLLFVRERLLRSEVDLVALLNLYAGVWRSRRRPRADQANPLVSVLQLSGVTREAAGKLHVRNRIYHSVFDLIWTARNFPDAEVRRQRAAYRRGALRSALVASGIVAAMSILVLIAVNNARARNAEARHSQQIARDLRRNLYAADMSSAQIALDDDNIGLAHALLEPYCPKVGQEDLRTFEWNYLWGLCRDLSLWTIHVPVGSGRIALSPDGRMLATGDGNGKVHLYDILIHRELQGPSLSSLGSVFDIAYSPDGRTIAWQTYHHTVVLWDVVNRREIGRINNIFDIFQNIAFSPDGHALAVTSADGPVTLWSIRPLRKLSSFPGHEFVVFSPDGKTIATQSIRNADPYRPDGRVTLWDLAAKHETTLSALATISVNCVCFSPNGMRLAAGLADGQMRVWDVATGRVLAAPAGHRSWIYSVAYSPDGTLLASGSADSTVKMWDSRTGRAITTLRGHKTEVCSVAFSSLGKILASGCADETIKLWTGGTDELQDVERSGKLAMSCDGTVEAYQGPRAGELTVCETATGRVTGHLGPTLAPQFPLCFSNDADRLYSILNNGSGLLSLVEWDLHLARETRRLQFKQGDFSPEISTVSPDARYWAASGWTDDGPVHLIDLTAMREVRKIEGTRAAFSPDCRLMAIGVGQIVKLYDIATLRQLGAPLPCSAGRMTFSHDGKLLVVGTTAGQVQVIDLSSRTMIREFTAHTSYIHDLALSPDDQTLVTGGGAPVLKLWNTRTWRQTAALRAPNPISAWFSPDGHALFVDTLSGPVHVFRAPQAVDMPPAIRR